MRLRCFGFILLLIQLPCVSFAQQFINTGVNLPGGYALAWGDYDSDGDMDAVVGAENYSSSYTRLCRNDGGKFTLIDHSSFFKGDDGQLRRLLRVVSFEDIINTNAH